MKRKKISLSDILFSKVRQRVLGALYTHPTLDFHTNEIIRMTHAGSGAVQRELQDLSQCGLLTFKKVGNQKRYQANKKTPLFSELHSIVIKTFGLADVIRNALEPIHENISYAFVYGSIAKQEETTESDIDLMIIGYDLNYAEIFTLLSDTEKQLARKINPSFYTEEGWSEKISNHNAFVCKVTDQPKIFLIGTEDEFNQFKKS